MRIVFLGLLVACGDNAAIPDAGPPDASDFAPACSDIVQTGPDMFSSPAELGPVARGTLQGWDPNGRWFLTGVRIRGQSSYHFERTGAQVVIDKDAQHLGSMDDDLIFQRVVRTTDTATTIIVKRVSDRLPDGSLRAVHAICDGHNCRVCAAKLVRAERFDANVSDHITLVSELNNPAWPPGYNLQVRVKDNIAYLVRSDGLYTIDITDPAHPVERGAYLRADDHYSNDIKLVDYNNRRYAILADSPSDVVDVTDPAAPTISGQILEEAHTLFTETRLGATHAYFGNYDGSTAVYDVTNPTAPTRLNKVQTMGALVHDLSVQDGVAYLNAWDAGLQVIDFNTPMPTKIGSWSPTPTRTSHSNWTTTAGGRKVLLHGEEYYGAHLHILDNDRASATYMQPFAEWKTRDWISIHNIMAFGNKAYFSYYQDGIRVLDISDPSKPKLAGYFNTWDPQAAYTGSAFFEGACGIDVDLQNKLIFVADLNRGLMILRDETP